MKRLMAMFAAAMAAVAMQFAAGAAFGETLDTLVLNGTTYTATENSTIGVLTVTDGTTGNVIDVPSGVTVAVTSYEGGGALTKTGAGTLSLSDVCRTADIAVDGGKIQFVDSDVASDTASVTTDAKVHVDASVASSVTTVNSGADKMVTKWDDVRGVTYASFTESIDPSSRINPYYRSSVLNNRAVVDFGSVADRQGGHSGYGGWLQLAGENVTGVKDLFMVLSDYPGTTTREDGALPQSVLGTINSNWYMFLRGPSSIYDGRWASVCTSPSWLDGVLINPTSVNMPEGFHLLRTRVDNVSNAGFNTLCNERNYQRGGLLLGEVVVYTKVIDEAVADRINRRLDWKWFSRRLIAKLTLNEGATLDLADGGTLAPAALVAPATAAVTGSGVLKSPADVNLTKLVLPQDGSFAADSGRTDVYVLDAPGKLTKTGAGELRLMALSSTSVDVQEGSLSMEIQTDTLTPAFHGDASRKDRVNHWYNTVKNCETLSEWSDLRASGPVCSRSTTYDAPIYDLEGTNGLPFIDFGESRSKAVTLTFMDGINKCEAFVVASDTQSAYDLGKYSPFLGRVWANKYELVRGGDGANAGLFKDNRVTCHLDCESVPYSTLLPSGFHVVHWRANDNNAAGFDVNCFARDRDTERSGGMLLGEALVYTNRIDSTSDECTKVNNYLMNKWLNGTRPGPSYTSVNVESGAAVTLPVRSTVSSLTGDGAVTAKHITLGSFDTVYDAPRAISGDVALAASGTISVTGAAGVRLRGPVTVLTATGGVTAGSLDRWTVTTDSKFRGTVKLSVVNGALVADFVPAGLFIVVQ